MLLSFTASCYILAHSSSQASCCFSIQNIITQSKLAAKHPALPSFCHPEVNDNPKIIKVYVVHALYVICKQNVTSRLVFTTGPTCLHVVFCVLESKEATSVYHTGLSFLEEVISQSLDYIFMCQFFFSSIVTASQVERKR